MTTGKFFSKLLDSIWRPTYKSVKHSQLRGNIGGFEWVDFLLYIYAISVVWINIIRYFILPSSNNAINYTESIGFYYTIIGLLLIFTITFIFFRNYLVMYSLDRRNIFNLLNYKFVDSHDPISSIFEKLFRALIIVWVIGSGRDVFPPFTNFIEWLVDKYIDLVNNIHYNYISVLFNTKDMQSNYIDVSYSHGVDLAPLIVVYYSIVLSVLFALFIVYDNINVFAVNKQIRNAVEFEGCTEIGIDQYGDDQKIAVYLSDKLKNNLVVRSMILYLGLTVPVKRVPTVFGESQNKSHRRIIAKRKIFISRGQIHKATRTSSKSLERIFGLTMGLSLIIWAGKYLNFLWVLPIILIVLYFVVSFLSTRRWETRVPEFLFGYFMTGIDARDPPRDE